MARFRFVPNPRFQQEIERQVEYVAGLEERAQIVVDQAKATAPVRKGFYKKGIKKKRVGKNVYVAATDFKSHWIEWGSINNRAHATIRRAVIAVGLRLFENERNRVGKDFSAVQPQFFARIRDVGE